MEQEPFIVPIKTEVAETIENPIEYLLNKYPELREDGLTEDEDSAYIKLVDRLLISRNFEEQQQGREAWKDIAKYSNFDEHYRIYTELIKYHFDGFTKEDRELNANTVKEVIDILLSNEEKDEFRLERLENSSALAEFLARDGYLKREEGVSILKKLVKLGGRVEALTARLVEMGETESGIEVLSNLMREDGGEYIVLALSLIDQGEKDFLPELIAKMLKSQRFDEITICLEKSQITLDKFQTKECISLFKSLRGNVLEINDPSKMRNFICGVYYFGNAIIKYGDPKESRAVHGPLKQISERI